MKVNADVTKISPRDQGLANTRDSSNAKDPKGIRTGQSENAAVKVSSPMLAKTKQILDDVAVVDRDRVKELKEKIKNGDYKIQPDKIADGMLKEAYMESKKA